MRGESSGANATELRMAHEATVQLLDAVVAFRRLGREFGVGKRPKSKRFAEIGTQVKELRTLLDGDGKEDKGVRAVIEPGLVWFARVQETTGVVTVHDLPAASAHKGVIALVEGMLAEPWAQAGFAKAFEKAADSETGYLDAKMTDQELYFAQQKLLYESLQFGEDKRVRELMEIEFAKALPMWREPDDASALTRLQWRILDLLADPPESNMSQRVIGERLRSEPGAGQLKGDLSNLRKRGLVENKRGRGYFRVEL